MNYKRMISGVTAAACCFVLAGCEKHVEVYKTSHDSGEWTISSLKKLDFGENASPGKVARKIPDFCIYESNGNYVASVPLTYNDISTDLTIKFNADQEFESCYFSRWVGDGADALEEAKAGFDEYYAMLEKDLGECSESPDGWEKLTFTSHIEEVVEYAYWYFDSFTICLKGEYYKDEVYVEGYNVYWPNYTANVTIRAFYS